MYSPRFHHNSYEFVSEEIRDTAWEFIWPFRMENDDGPNWGRCHNAMRYATYVGLQFLSTIYGHFLKWGYL